MNKTFKKNLDLYFNELKNLSNRPKHELEFIIKDNNKIFITNSYGLIRFTNNQIINDLQMIYKTNIKENVVKTIIQTHETQFNNNYSNRVMKISDINSDEIRIDDRFNKKYVTINGRDFDYIKIKHIQNLLGKESVIYSSDNDDKFINIVGKNGYAFLLGCIIY